MIRIEPQHLALIIRKDHALVKGVLQAVFELLERSLKARLVVAEVN
jgi:hypothetical protein